MHILFTGGGTGGHALPNIALITELRRCHPDANAVIPAKAGISQCEAPAELIKCSYLGLRNAIEERFANRIDVPFYPISAGKFRRYFDLRNFIDAIRSPWGVVQALRILRKLRPQLVFAKGGYVSVPVVIASRMLAIPVWLHESDVTPGLANRVCARFAERIFVSFEQTKAHFLSREVVVSGNPIRESVYCGDREKGLRMAGFSKKKPVLLVLGGSTGAAAVNEIIKSALPELLKHCQVFHITGSGKAIDFQAPGYFQTEFLDEALADAYAMATSVVSRAGSGTIFETLACNKPMLLVPLPRDGSRGDQIENAAVFEAKGWAKTRSQDSVNAQTLIEWGENSALHETMKFQQKKSGTAFAREATKIVTGKILSYRTC